MVQRVSRFSAVWGRAILTAAAARARTHALVLGALIGGAALATPARAGIFTVTNNSDSGPGSLRQAILDAELAPGPDTIVFDADYTITLAGPLPVVTTALTIQGTGAAGTIVQGGGWGLSIFEVTAPAELLLDRMTVRDGATGIRNWNANVTVTNCTVSDNVSVIQASDGGGIYSGGVLNLTNCTVSGNRALFYGGGIAAWGPATTVINSTISGNSATLFGGGGAESVS